MGQNDKSTTTTAVNQQHHTHNLNHHSDHSFTYSQYNSTPEKHIDTAQQYHTQTKSQSESDSQTKFQLNGEDSEQQTTQSLTLTSSASLKQNHIPPSSSGTLSSSTQFDVAKSRLLLHRSGSLSLSVPHTNKNNTETKPKLTEIFNLPPLTEQLQRTSATTPAQPTSPKKATVTFKETVLHTKDKDNNQHQTQIQSTNEKESVRFQFQQHNGNSVVATPVPVAGLAPAPPVRANSTPGRFQSFFFLRWKSAANSTGSLLIGKRKNKFSPRDGKIHVNSDKREHEDPWHSFATAEACVRSLREFWTQFCCTCGVPSDGEIDGIENIKFKTEEERIQEEWQKSDVNNSGTLSLKEVKLMLTRLNVSLPHNDVVEWFTNYDNTKSNSITFREFKQMFHSLQSVPDLREEFLRAKLRQQNDDAIIEQMGITYSKDWQKVKWEYLVPGDLQWFFEWASNGEEKVTEAYCAELIRRYSPNKEEENRPHELIKSHTMNSVTLQSTSNGHNTRNGPSSSIGSVSEAITSRFPLLSPRAALWRFRAEKPGSGHENIADDQPQLSYESFVLLVTDVHKNAACDPNKTKKVYQDMTQPLSHYFISSSHNTYLTGNQLNSESTGEAIKRVLRRGVRVIEIDAWDGADGIPIVTHGHTLCKPTTFEKCIEIINEFAFSKSEYPVIITIENHCSRKQQKKQVKFMRNILGEKLFIWDFGLNSLLDTQEVKADDFTEDQLRKVGPLKWLSPEDLKLKVVIRDRPIKRLTKKEKDDLKEKQKQTEKTKVKHLELENRPESLTISTSVLPLVQSKSPPQPIRLIKDKPKPIVQSRLYAAMTNGYKNASPRNLVIAKTKKNFRATAYETSNGVRNGFLKRNASLQESNLKALAYISQNEEVVDDIAKPSSDHAELASRVLLKPATVENRIVASTQSHLNRIRKTNSTSRLDGAKVQVDGSKRVFIDSKKGRSKSFDGMWLISKKLEEATAVAPSNGEGKLNVGSGDSKTELRRINSCPEPNPAKDFLTIKKLSPLKTNDSIEKSPTFMLPKMASKNIKKPLRKSGAKVGIEDDTVSVNSESSNDYDEETIFDKNKNIKPDEKDIQGVHKDLLRIMYIKNIAIPVRNVDIKVDADLADDASVASDRLDLDSKPSIDMADHFPDANALHIEKTNNNVEVFKTIESEKTKEAEVSSSPRLVGFSPMLPKDSNNSSLRQGHSKNNIKAIKDIENPKNSASDAVLRSGQNIYLPPSIHLTAASAIQAKSKVKKTNDPKEKVTTKIKYIEPNFVSSSSLQENVMKNLCSPGHNCASINTYSKDHLVRIFPAGKRITSSNYDPIPAWNAGCQIVALNYQCYKLKVWLNQGKFRLNGGCGYVLKPPFMLLAKDVGVVRSEVRQAKLRELENESSATFDEKENGNVLSPEENNETQERSSPSEQAIYPAWTMNLELFTPKKLIVRVISAHYLPKTLGSMKYNKKTLINPFVEIKLRGPGEGPMNCTNQSYKTKWIDSNGFNPRWNETFKFKIYCRELTLLAFVVKSKEKRLKEGLKQSNDNFVAQQVVPLEGLRAGFRTVSLLLANGSSIESAYLLCRFIWE